MGLIKDARFARGLLAQNPFQVLVQVTNRCNMRCAFCDFWPNGAHPSQELAVEDYRRLAAELAELGCFLISIEGGEPFVRKDLMEIVEALSRDHVTVLYTNGWHVTEANARELFDRGLSQVGVSIDFPDAPRHDRKRDLDGAFERAWRAVDHLAQASPDPARHVHVMTVLMEENYRDLEALLQQSEARGVGHNITLLSVHGFRREDAGGAWPAASVSEELLRLWRRYPHFRSLRDYLARMDTFLHDTSQMPTCRAGAQSFNIDHLGEVSPCIEKIDRSHGNVRHEPLAAIWERMAADRQEVAGCQQCWTLCRGIGQLLGGGGTVQSWIDLGTRLR